MEALARHQLFELYGCDPAILNDAQAITRIMLEAARLAGATIVGERFHQFQPQGVSGVVFLAESHLAVHTWPEHGYAAVDLFTCGVLGEEACFRHLAAELASKKSSRLEIPRGTRGNIENF